MTGHTDPLEFGEADPYIEDQQAYWSSDAVQRRVASVGAVHPALPTPRGVRERIERWRLHRRVYALYRAGKSEVGQSCACSPRAKLYQQIDEGRLDLATWCHTRAHLAETRAGIG